MAVPPATSESFIELIKKSGVTDAQRLDDVINRRRAEGRLHDNPARLAKSLLREGLLTRFQAEQLLLGKWRRFAIGNFRVLERLGSGGMSQVYLCEHIRMHHQVAVKVLANHRADDPTIVKRFQREGRASAALDHPNIVRAHDIGVDHDLHYLVMDYVHGSSLQHIVDTFGPLDALRAAHYIYQAAIGLHHAHQSGLIHRDVKPANLLLDRNGVVKILDLGMARFFMEADERLTHNLIGTADYLAPEQARDSHKVDVRADIYSLGATFYFLLAGCTPYDDAKSVGLKLIALQSRPPRPLRELRPEVPAKLAALIEKMMNKDPEERYQTLAEVIRDFTPWVQNPIGPPPEKEMPIISVAARGARSTEFEIMLPPTTGGDRRSGSQLSLALRPQDRAYSLIGVIALTAVVTAVLAAVFWWLFLRADH